MSRVNVGGERHPAGVDLQYLAGPVAIGDADLDLPVEAAGTAQRRIEILRDVGRADHYHLTARFQAVHQREQLRDHALLNLALDLGPLRRDARRSRRGR
jgi:hypothetical protein